MNVLEMIQSILLFLQYRCSDECDSIHSSSFFFLFFLFFLHSKFYKKTEVSENENLDEEKIRKTKFDIS